MQPIGDNIVVRVTAIEERNSSGLILGESPWTKCYILAVGNGYRVSGGDYMPLIVKVGDTVLVHKMNTEHASRIPPFLYERDGSILPGSFLCLIREQDIVAILSKEEIEATNIKIKME